MKTDPMAQIENVHNFQTEVREMHSVFCNLYSVFATIILKIALFFVKRLSVIKVNMKTDPMVQTENPIRHWPSLSGFRGTFWAIKRWTNHSYKEVVCRSNPIPKSLNTFYE